MKQIFTWLTAVFALVIISAISLDANNGTSLDNQTKCWNVTVTTDKGSIYQLPAGTRLNDPGPKVDTWTIDDNQGNHFVFPADFCGEIMLNNGDTYHISTTRVSIVIIDDSHTG